jgi:hypothetical protein
LETGKVQRLTKLLWNSKQLPIAMGLDLLTIWVFQCIREDHCRSVRKDEREEWWRGGVRVIAVSPGGRILFRSNGLRTPFMADSRYNFSDILLTYRSVASNVALLLSSYEHITVKVPARSIKTYAILYRELTIQSQRSLPHSAADGP